MEDTQLKPLNLSMLPTTLLTSTPNLQNLNLLQLCEPEGIRLPEGVNIYIYMDGYTSALSDKFETTQKPQGYNKESKKKERDLGDLDRAFVLL